MATNPVHNNENPNSFQVLYSKVRRIYIPLPGFKFFHRPSEVDDVDSQFVGRQRILALLKNWLQDKNGNSTGSYLITGYRGMGKTSFVSKAIDELIKDQKQKQKLQKILRSFSKMQGKLWNEIYPLLIGILIAIPSSLIFSILIFYDEFPCWACKVLVIYSVGFLLLAIWWGILKWKERYILKIKVNIGNEVSEAKDVLSLLAYSIRNRFNEFIDRTVPTFPWIVGCRFVTWTAVSAIVYLISRNFMDVVEPAGIEFLSSWNNSLIFHSIEFINGVLVNLKEKEPIASILGIVLLFPIVYFLWSVAVRFLIRLFEYFGRPLQRPAQLKKELQDLCNRIDASVKEDNDPYDFKLSAFSLIMKHKSSRHYQPASVREIEQSLTDIIEKIQDSIILRCRLIVILDEMDKLSKTQMQNETFSADFPEFTSNENGVSDEITQNEKRHRILSLLGQLKYFISTAKAKFIFIAGHELYDAYLADVSDREYSISSIFNGVINVDSFFTCNSRTKDITKLTEAYVCKHLIGTKEIESVGWESDAEEYNLGKYWQLINQNNPGASKEELRERMKIFTFLRQFVTYLTFVSNGAPKKLTAHFEKYIISKEVFNKQNFLGEEPNGAKKCGISEKMVLNEPAKVQTEDASEYYLAFGYYDQQKIGFIHYMAYPIFENIISPSSEYGDKLLIASSFLIAHIYKHHTSGFSWRNLEYLPELIDSNRTPELREYINSIIGYLAKIHLTAITSGIYTYKFPMRLVEEISIFTKKSEELSAIFNFSLDYSLAVKKYYYRLLDFYRTRQSGSEVVKASLHHNLGDIHLSNDEYTEAIVQFRLTADSIETQIRKLKNDPRENISSLIVRYTRVMLKLGLAYEKRNTIDSAYLVYSNLMTKLIAHREIDERNLHLEYKIAKEQGDNNYWQGKRVLLFRPEQTCNIDEFCRKCYPAPYSENEDKDVKYWIYGDELTDNLCDFLSSTKEAIITKLSVYEDLRVAFLPILAKLFALEKHNICGITRDNVKVAEAEFQYLFLITNSKDKYLLRVDFYRKLGDILYYKNRYFYENERDSAMALFACWGYDLKSAIFDCCYRAKMCKADIESIMELFHNPLKYDKIVNWDEFRRLLVARAGRSQKTIVRKIMDEIPEGMKLRIASILECGCRRKNVKNTPCFACRYYNRSLEILKDKLFYRDGSDSCSDGTSKVFQFLEAIESEDERRIICRYNELTQVALTLESMGDTLLSCSSKTDRISTEFMTSLFLSDIERLMKARGSIGHLEKSILYYWTAMKYHGKASNNKESVQCLLKILKVLHAYTSGQNRIGGFSSILNPMKDVVMEAIRGLYSTRDFYNIEETKKLNDIFALPVNLGLTSVMPEVEELLMAYYEIVMHQLRIINRNKYRQLLNAFYQSPSMSYLRNDSLIYNRVISLLFKAKMNERVMLEMGYDLIAPPMRKKDAMPNPLHSPSGQDAFWDVLFEEENADRRQVEKLHKMIGECLGEKKPIRDAVEFLIADSIFCLANITDYILPTLRTTLFTNSFCYSVYVRLYYWVKWKEAYIDSCETHKEDASRLEKAIGQLVEAHNMEMLKPTFLREMANKHCVSAKEMHSEGDEYQDFIKGFYLLDDDLQNNTCQFYFALERYKINSEKLNEIPSTGTNSRSYYAPEQYYRWPKKNG